MHRIVTITSVSLSKKGGKWGWVGAIFFWKEPENDIYLPHCWILNFVVPTSLRTHLQAAVEHPSFPIWHNNQICTWISCDFVTMTLEKMFPYLAATIWLLKLFSEILQRLPSHCRELSYRLMYCYLISHLSLLENWKLLKPQTNMTPKLTRKGAGNLCSWLNHKDF